MSDGLLIRADGSDRMGTGHVMRCLALAQGWGRSGGNALFVLASSTPALEQRLHSEGIEFVRLGTAPGSGDDAAETAALARQHDASWVVADGYSFGAGYQERIKEAGLRLLLLDDYGHAGHYWADYVLNQNLSADPKLYSSREPYTRLLLGTRYVLLREQFDKWRNWKREIPATARKVLVTLGGSDPDNITHEVIEALQQLNNEELDSIVVAGGSNRHSKDLQVQCNDTAQRIQLVVDATDMPELMAGADVAVAAAGTTSWELAFMGLPSVTIVLADNQAATASALNRVGISVNAGRGLQFTVKNLAILLQSLFDDCDRRRQMSRKGRELVDGLGVYRVVTKMHAKRLRLRRADETDCRLIWKWANDPEARAVSFSSDSISWENHVSWFATKSRDPNCFFYVAVNDSRRPVGQVRFERSGREAVLSINLSPAVRGKGLGSALIVRAAEQFFVESDTHVVHAYIKPENLASVRAFEKADFKDAGAINLRGDLARHFILEREFV